MYFAFSSRIKLTWFVSGVFLSAVILSHVTTPSSSIGRVSERPVEVVGVFELCMDLRFYQL